MKVKGFGMRLKELRFDKNLTQADLAEASGVSAASVAKWETERFSPKRDAIDKMAPVLGMTGNQLSAYLFGGGSQPETPKEMAWRLYQSVASDERVTWFDIYTEKEGSLVKTGVQVPYKVPEGCDKESVFALGCTGKCLSTVPAGSTCYICKNWYDCHGFNNGDAVMFKGSDGHGLGLIHMFGGETSIVNRKDRYPIGKVELIGKILDCSHPIDDPSI